MNVKKNLENAHGAGELIGKVMKRITSKSFLFVGGVILTFIFGVIHLIWGMGRGVTQPTEDEHLFV